MNNVAVETRANIIKIIRSMRTEIINYYGAYGTKDGFSAEILDLLIPVFIIEYPYMKKNIASLREVYGETK